MTYIVYYALLNIITCGISQSWGRGGVNVYNKDIRSKFLKWLGFMAYQLSYLMHAYIKYNL